MATIVTHELINLLQTLISIDSTPENGNLECAVFLKDWFEDLGFKCRLLEDQYNGRPQANLIAMLGNPGEKHLALLNHLDTVSAGDTALWTETNNNPFASSVRDGYIYGLGSADSKGGMASKMLAIKRLIKSGWEGHFYVVGTYGEEMGLQGATHISKENVRAEYVMVGEPTRLAYVRANKGYMIYELKAIDEISAPIHMQVTEAMRLRFRGKASHSSTPQRGVNAVLKCCDVLRTLRNADPELHLYQVTGGISHNVVPAACDMTLKTKLDLRSFSWSQDIDIENVTVTCAPISLSFEKRMQFYLNELMVIAHTFKANVYPGFDPAYTTLSIGQLEMDSQALRIVWDVRPHPGMRLCELQTLFNGFREHCLTSALVCEINEKRSVEAFDLAPDHNFIQFLQLIDEKPCDVKSGCTEASVLVQNGFIPVVHGPGLATGNIHRPNECCSVAELVEAVYFYEKLLLICATTDGVRA
ncbi:MAG: M20/M25/M40 family metallo-hydrolase [Chlamydiota bacterium]|nr:M20/M25/M40 family metallo-hydrolase [Chlamydiota bacterium]